MAISRRVLTTAPSISATKTPSPESASERVAAEPEMNPSVGSAGHSIAAGDSPQATEPRTRQAALRVLTLYIHYRSA